LRNWSSICPKMSFDSVPAAVQTGKSDFAARCITISDERAESIKTGSEKG
jgi:ABC-type amino acid transport substrate-binding protein